MKKLRIKTINGYEYELIDSKDNVYKTSMEFYDLTEELKVDDYIFISEKLLDKNYREYDNFYRFGKLDSIYGRKLEDEDNIDVIGLKIEDKIISLQRYYG